MIYYEYRRYRIFPVEVKASSRINQKSIFQLIEYLRVRGGRQGYVVYTGPAAIRQVEDVELVFIPPYYLPGILTGRTEA